MPGCSSVPPCFHRVAALSDTLLQLVWKVGIRVRGQGQGQSDPFDTADLFNTEETRWGGGGLPLHRPERRGLVSGLLPKMACREMLGSQPWLSGLYVFFGCDSQCLLGGDSAVLAPLPSRQRPDLGAMSMRPRCQPLREVSWTQVVMRAAGPASGQTPKVLKKRP